MKSLELNWIRRKVDKTIPIPEVMYFPFVGVSGRYYHPSLKNEIFDNDGKPYSMKYGVIAINSNYTDKNVVEGMIAHEWRHHWQYFNGVKMDVSPLDLFSKMNYKEALIKYFTTSKTEFDAIRFQYEHSFIYDVWEKILFDLIKDLHVKPIITYGNNTLSSNKPKIQSRNPIVGYSYSFNKKT